MIVPLIILLTGTGFALMAFNAHWLADIVNGADDENSG
jgi:hypothetical protein